LIKTKFNQAVNAIYAVNISCLVGKVLSLAKTILKKIILSIHSIILYIEIQFIKKKFIVDE
jgi:hypothetical protein